MTLNLDKNRDSLIQAWKQVLDEQNSTDWALFGYDGQTYDLNLVSKGDGGLEEMIDDFNSGKIQYALCRVKIKEKNVEKIVLINWQGEGAPLARKGMCANHIGSVKSFFKGVHLTLNARTDEDVEPDVILGSVSKAISGEGVKLSTVIEPEIGPVGTTYKRVNPQEEINVKAKDDFWRKEEQEEERRKREEQNRHRKFSQDEVKLLRKESQEYFDKAEEVVQKYQSTTSTPKTTPSPQPQPQRLNGFSNGNSNGNGLQDSNSSSPVPPQECAAATAAALKASMPMKNNSDLVRQRIKSFDGGSSGPVFPKISNGTSSNSNSNVTSLSPAAPSFAKSPSPTPTPTTTPNMTNNSTVGQVNGHQSESLSVLKRKQLFESGGASNTTSTIGRKNPADEIKKAQEELKKKEQQQAKSMPEHAKQEVKKVEPTPISAPQQTMPRAQPEILKNEPQPKQNGPVQVPYQPQPEVVKKELQQQQLQNGAVPKSSIPEPKVISPTAHFQPDVISNSIHVPASPSPEPQKPPQAFFNHHSSQMNRSPIPPKSPSPQPIIQKQNQPDIVEDTSVRSAQASYVGTAASVSPVPQEDEGETITIEILPEMGLCARALYDYQAADDTEITFDPGEIITNIEKIDEGWWEGLTRGQYGLFPANYVELLN